MNVEAPNPHPSFNVTGTSITTSRNSYDTKKVESQIRENLKNPATNPAHKLADEYTRQAHGHPYDFTKTVTSSSAEKQKSISDAFLMAANDHPGYKEAVFKAYQEKRPDIIKQLGANDYDDLVHKSYNAVADETNAQFKKIPVRMQYHTGGLSYHHSGELLNDVYHHGNLTVYQGGDKHEFLHQEDPDNGLNTNEKFRAVHDFFGHAIHGNSFGPIGEEIAWDSHRKMYSPGAQVAMTAETRGQNSHVNYSGMNDEVSGKMDRIRNISKEAAAGGRSSAYYEHRLRHIGRNEWNYAPQKSIALPPEMLDPHYDGKMPEYLSALHKVDEAVNFLSSKLKERVDNMPSTLHAVKKQHDQVFGEGVDTITVPLDRSNELPITHGKLQSQYGWSHEGGSRGHHVAKAVEAAGYHIVDYVGGKAMKLDATDKNLTSIGKILNKPDTNGEGKFGDRLTRFKTTPKFKRDAEGRALNGDGNPIATHGGNRVLEKMPTEMNLLDAYNSDPMRKNSKGDHVMVISRHPHDVAGMSTNQNWRSCMNLVDGAYKKHVPEDLRHGTLVAYLAHKDHEKDDSLKPMGRVAIKRFNGDEGHIAMVPEGRQYGNVHSTFVNAVNDFAAKNYPLRDDQNYSKAAGLYNDDGKTTIMNRKYDLSEGSKKAILHHIQDNINVDREVQDRAHEKGEYPDYANERSDHATLQIMKKVPGALRAHLAVHAVSEQEDDHSGRSISDEAGGEVYHDPFHAISSWANNNYTDKAMMSDLKELPTEHISSLLDRMHSKVAGNSDAGDSDSYNQSKHLHYNLLNHALNATDDVNGGNPHIHKIMHHMNQYEDYYQDMENEHGSVFSQHPAMYSENPRTIHTAIQFAAKNSDYENMDHDHVLSEHIGKHGDSESISEHALHPEADHEFIASGLSENKDSENIEHELTHRLPLSGGSSSSQTVFSNERRTTYDSFNAFGQKAWRQGSETEVIRDPFSHSYPVKKSIHADSVDHDTPMIAAIAAHTKNKSVFDKISTLHAPGNETIKDALRDNPHHTLVESANTHQSFTGLPDKIKQKRADEAEERRMKFKPTKFSEFLKSRD